MEATITSPSGKTELCEIRGMGDSLCSLKFKPQEDGVNNISLKYKGLHFAGEFLLLLLTLGAYNHGVFQILFKIIWEHYLNTTFPHPPYYTTTTPSLPQHYHTITGSPFQFTVGKAPTGGTHRIEFGGPGVEQGEVDSKS